MLRNVQSFPLGMHIATLASHHFENPAERRGVQATANWLSSSGAAFPPIGGEVGYAQLTHYTAEYCELGDGPPLVVIPGMAGGFRLLGPIADYLARNFRVITYQLRGEDNCFAM